MDAADLLLAGPRGRWLCMAAALERSDELDRLLDRTAGESCPAIGSVHLPPADRDALTDALGAIDPAPLATITDPLDLFVVLGSTVDRAMPWQPPFASDQLTGIPEVQQALRPVAEALLAAPAAQWWSTDVQLQAQQEEVSGVADRTLLPLEYAPAAAELAAFHDAILFWEQEIGARSGAERSGGEWWSFPTAWTVPDVHRLIATTRSLPGLPAVRPALQEDSAGPEQLLVRAATPTGAPLRVFEVHGPADWVRLVDRYPIEVSNARESTWLQSTGRSGRWFIPDYRAVAEDWDAVHVSVIGYLGTAGTALPVEQGRTVLAGWDPDVTYWLRDVVALGAPRRFTRGSGEDLHRWRPAPVEGTRPAYSAGCSEGP